MSDDTLLTRAVEHGDPEAIEALIIGQLGRIHAVCSGLVRDREVAAELSQEAVLRVFKSIPRFKRQCAWSTWTYRIARNLCLNWLEKMREDSGDDGSRLVDPRDDAIEEQAHGERARGVREALSKLSAEEREAMLLHYEGGLSVDEVTEMMGLTNRSGARGVLQRARRKLKKEALRSMPEDSIVRRGMPPSTREAMERTLHELTRAPGGPVLREPSLAVRTRGQLLD
ncbi:MAG TPA: sigma-70 family RNA polymerase sigma factor [Myxococcota bacterium]|nr:sigma-70 family RNA polymerase sigma factor [Myxococcota bacterium]